MSIPVPSWALNAYVSPYAIQCYLADVASMAEPAMLVPQVQAIAAESATGLIGLELAGSVLSVLGVVAVGGSLVVGAILGSIELYHLLSRDAVAVRGDHGLFFVTNAENLTLADMKVLKGMRVRRDTEECCGASFVNYEMGWNRTGTLHHNEDHVKYGVRHGHFTIHMEDKNKVDPRGLWIHLARNATKEQIDEAENLRKGLNATALDHGEARKLLTNLFTKLVNVTSFEQEDDA